MPETTATQSLIAGLTSDISLIPRNPQVTAEAAADGIKGAFAEAVATAVALTGETADNTAVDNSYGAAVCGGQGIELVVMAGDQPVAAKPLDVQAVQVTPDVGGGDGSSNPIGQAAEALVAGETPGAQGQKGPRNAATGRSGRVSGMPQKHARVSAGALTEGAVVVEEIVGEARPRNNSGRAMGQAQCEQPVRDEVQGATPEGNTAGALLTATQETSGVAEWAQAAEARIENVEPAVGSAGLAVEGEVRESEPSGDVERVQGDRPPIHSAPAKDGAARSVFGGDVQTAGSEARSVRGEARQSAELDAGTSVTDGADELQGVSRPPAADDSIGRAGPEMVKTVVPSELRVRQKDLATGEADTVAAPTDDAGAVQETEPTAARVEPAIRGVGGAKEPAQTAAWALAGRTEPDRREGAKSGGAGRAAVAAGNDHGQLSDGSTGSRGLDSTPVAETVNVSSTSGPRDSAHAAPSRVAVTPQDLGRQMADGMQASLARGEREIVVRLRPPELGNVVVRFREQDGQLHGLLEVGSSDTRREIERALPEMLQNLHEQGMQIRKLDVTLADQTQGDAGKGQWQQQDAWSRQNWGQGREPFGAPPARWPHPNADSPAQDTPNNEQAAEAPHGRINMLL